MKAIKSEILLLITATIWGFSFVAQRMGMEFIDPLMFNGIRFMLGSLSLLPIVIFSNKERFTIENFKYGLIAGIILFVAAWFQQFGIKYTTAGKAGFITGLYVILVPIFGIFLKKKTPKSVWFASLLAIGGLFLISNTEDKTILFGDFLVLISSFFWAAHVLFMDKISKKQNIVSIAFFQFFIASILNLAIGLFVEDYSIGNIMQAKIPIIYGGVFSVGIAFTLQIFGQRDAHPAHAAIILSFEGAFAVIGGWLILNEKLDFLGIIGCSLILVAMIIPQIFKNRQSITI